MNKPKTDWKTGWKVVIKNPLRYDYFSCNTSYFYSVRYGVGLESVPQPECGPLAVFNSLANAKDFCIQRYIPSQLYIAKCQYIKDNKSQNLWTPYGKRRVDTLPKGTTLAQKVKLIEEPVIFLRARFNKNNKRKNE